jgi:ABC-2 type transport system ATP-binding protein
VIAFSGLRKRFGRVLAIDGVDLRLGPGELVGLVGENGAGKTTLMAVAAGLLLPTEGTARICGVDVSSDPGAARAHLGIVREEPPLWAYLTARELLEFVREVRGRGNVDAALDLAGLGSDADRLIREYSQGMRRKTALAAAVMGDPEVLLLDEALNGLDPPSALRVEAYLRGMVGRGCTVLLSTHVFDTLRRAADRVVHLHAGKVVADARAAELGPGGIERFFTPR